MRLLDYISLTIGILGLALAGRYYLELWRWAKQCQRARIAIAYNNRVKLQAPLVEWLKWANSLKGKDENGRVVYRANKMTVSILRPATPVQAKTTVKTIRHSQRSRKGNVPA